ncbi:MAG: uridine kinase [Ignavibacteriales bacterium]|nr:uridine kinase [Ignavibacteriales bacterium]
MNSLIIGIAGGSGAGKTTVTTRILESLDSTRVSVIPHDAYYHDCPPDAQGNVSLMNFDHPDSLETSLLVGHLRELRAGKAVEIPVYDFATYRRTTKTQRVNPTDVVIVEGILIFVSRDLRDLMDIRMYIDTDADERLLRRLKRDLRERDRSVESVMVQYLATVKPMHLEFVEPSKRWADVIIPRGVENAVAIDLVVTRIKSLLEARRSGES